jgi:hypothetical protein
MRKQLQMTEFHKLSSFKMELYGLYNSHGDPDNLSSKHTFRPRTDVRTLIISITLSQRLSMVIFQISFSSSMGEQNIRRLGGVLGCDARFPSVVRQRSTYSCGLADVYLPQRSPRGSQVVKSATALESTGDAGIWSANNDIAHSRWTACCWLLISAVSHEQSESPASTLFR